MSLFFHYSGGVISISYREMSFGTTVPMNVLMKYDSYIFHGPHTVATCQYVKALDYDKVYSYQFRHVVSDISEEYSVTRFRNKRKLHVVDGESSCSCDFTDANVYNVYLERELTTGVLYEIFGYAGSVPIDKVPRILGCDLLDRLTGRIRGGFFFPKANKFSNARVRFPYVMCNPHKCAVGMKQNQGNYVSAVDYGRYFVQKPLIGDYSLVIFKMPCVFEYDATCVHEENRVNKGHRHIVGVSEYCVAEFKHDHVPNDILARNNIPKLFRGSWLGTKFKRYDYGDWRDNVDAFIAYQESRNVFYRLDHEWIYFPLGNDTYVRCEDFLKKPFNELRKCVGKHYELLTWLGPKMLQSPTYPGWEIALFDKDSPMYRTVKEHRCTDNVDNQE